MEKGLFDYNIGDDVLIDEIYNYKIIDIKEGGMSIVMIAERLSDAEFHDLFHRKQIAMKKFKKNPGGELDAKLFEHELKIWINLDNTSIVPLQKIIMMKNDLLAIMPFYPGNLRSIMESEERISVTQYAKVLLNILLGLSYAFKNFKVVHQDIKPENVLSDNLIFSENNMYFVTDWGISNLQSYYLPRDPFLNENRPQLFETLSRMGTLPYMSPERLLGHPSDFRMDIYSLGIMFFEMLLGYLPFDLQSGKEMPYQILEGDYYFIADALLTGSYDKKICKTILKCINPEIDRRYKNYGKLMNDLYKLYKINL
ncbi:serine/threonine-protein kinase [Thermodesulfobacteriota bacterium]